MNRPLRSGIRRGRLVLWDLAVGCGPGMPGPYRAAMGKLDIPAGWRAAYMRPLQIGGSLQLRGFGALGGAQRAPPASKAGPLLRLLAPQGQALLTTPVSLRSTVAPCSQPRTPSQQRQFSLVLSFAAKRKNNLPGDCRYPFSRSLPPGTLDILPRCLVVLGPERAVEVRVIAKAAVLADFIRRDAAG